MNALVGPFSFLLKSLATLYIAAFLIRFLLQLAQGDFRNPVGQFLLRLTHPVVRPLRRVIPPVGNVDSATLVVMLVLEALTIVLLGLLNGILIHPLDLARVTAGSLLHLTASIYIGCLIVLAILSWIRPGYHPVAAAMDDLVRPVLRPFRRLLPSAGGIDFSPMIAIIILLFLKQLLYAVGLFDIWDTRW